MTFWYNASVGVTVQKSCVLNFSLPAPIKSVTPFSERDSPATFAMMFNSHVAVMPLPSAAVQ